LLASGLGVSYAQESPVAGKPAAGAWALDPLRESSFDGALAYGNPFEEFAPVVLPPDAVLGVGEHSDSGHGEPGAGSWQDAGGAGSADRFAGLPESDHGDRHGGQGSGTWTGESESEGHGGEDCTVAVTVVPEANSGFLLAAGLLGLFFLKRNLLRPLRAPARPRR